MADDESNSALKRLPKEWRMVQKKGVAGVEFELGKTDSGEPNYLEWNLVVTGPEEYTINDAVRPCPYAGAKFPVTMSFPSNYPFKAPDMKFKTGLLYHPNVSIEDGSICADMIASVFGPTKNVTHLAGLITEFLGRPNLESPLEGDIAAEMATDIEKYEREAAKMARGSKK